MTNEYDDQRSSQMTIGEWPEWKWFEAVVVLARQALAKAEGDANSASAIFPFLDSVLNSAGSLRMLVREANCGMRM